MIQRTLAASFLVVLAVACGDDSGSGPGGGSAGLGGFTGGGGAAAGGTGGDMMGGTSGGASGGAGGTTPAGSGGVTPSGGTAGTQTGGTGGIQTGGSGGEQQGGTGGGQVGGSGGVGGNLTGGTGGGSSAVPWACSEHADACLCLQTASPPATHDLAACTLAFPCCIAYDIENSSTLASCFCYSSNYLDQFGTCDELLNNVAANEQYSSARTVATCPQP